MGSCCARFTCCRRGRVSGGGCTTTVTGHCCEDQPPETCNSSSGSSNTVVDQGSSVVHNNTGNVHIESVENLHRCDTTNTRRDPTSTNSVNMPYGATAHCTLASHTSDVNGVAFGDSLLASCGGDKVVRVWSLDDFSEVGYSPLRGHRYSINGCVFSPVNNLLVSYSTDGKAIVWSAKTGDQVCVLTHPSQSSIRVCRFSPSGDALATGSDDETLCLWDLATQKIIRSFEGHEASLPACAFSPNSAFIVCGNVLGYLKVFDTLGRVQRHLSYEMNAHDLGVTCCEFSPTYGSADVTNPPPEDLSPHLLPDQEDVEEGEKFSADAPKLHYLLATCGYDNNIKLWDFVAYAESISVKLNLRNTLSGHNDSVMCCTFSPDGLLLASAAGDKTVRLWDPLRGEPVHTILGHSRFVTCCAFSMDGRFLASGSNDRYVKVWRVGRLDDMTQEPCKVEPVEWRAESEVAGAGGLDTAYYMKDLADWGMDEVSQWLTDLGMEQYIGQFRAHAIDGTELLTLNAELLEKKLGVGVLGHRNKLARTIEELRERPARHQQASVNGIPDEFLCPITREIMADPVIAADGFTYERAAITDWMKRGKTYSPMTNAALANTTLTPNRSVKMLLQRHLHAAN